ncbi:hypothetical protein B0H19DRAFT_1083501 [Mycena capillaripes]|nr:hypothetical protein B0H19DRAFT_1083501 [Mycena capillaripes]
MCSLRVLMLRKPWRDKPEHVVGFAPNVARWRGGEFRGNSAKADQIAFIYTKLFHVLNAARAFDQGPLQGKTDKWFNLKTPLAAPGSTPTTEHDAYCAFPTAPPPAALAWHLHRARTAARPPGGMGTHVGAFSTLCPLDVVGSDTSRSSSTDEEADVLPPTIYKNAIPLFRALFALLRILPAWRVVRKLAGRRAPGGGPTGGKRGLRPVTLVFFLHFSPFFSSIFRILYAPRPSTPNEPLHHFPRVYIHLSVLCGTLTLSVTYLITPTFSLESLEALLSSHFAVLDARPAVDVGSSSRRDPSARYLKQYDDEDDAEFVPTLARWSITTSTTSTVHGDGGGLAWAIHDAALARGFVAWAVQLHVGIPTARGFAETATEGYPYRTSTDSDAPSPSPSSPYRTASGASPYRTMNKSQASSGSASTSYRMGVHVAPAHRRDSSGGRGDLVDSLCSEGAGRAGAGSVGRGGEYGYPHGTGPLPSKREQEREREKGVPIGSAVESGGSGLGLGTASGSGSSGAGGISASRPNAITINPFKSNTLSRSSLSGLRGVGAAGSPERTGTGATSPMGVAFPAHATPPPPVAESAGAGAGAGAGASASGGLCKRYSSSFPHRYGAAAGSSAGSGGSRESGSASGSLGVGARPSVRQALAGVGAGPSTSTPRGHCSGGIGNSSRGILPMPSASVSPTMARTQTAARRPRARARPGQVATAPGSTAAGTGARTMTLPAFGAPQAMLKSADEVDARLRSMNEEFMRNLVGLDSGGRRTSMIYSPVGMESGSTSARNERSSGLGGGSWAARV